MYDNAYVPIHISTVINTVYWLVVGDSSPAAETKLFTSEQRELQMRLCQRIVSRLGKQLPEPVFIRGLGRIWGRTYGHESDRVGRWVDISQLKING